MLLIVFLTACFLRLDLNLATTNRLRQTQTATRVGRGLEFIPSRDLFTCERCNVWHHLIPNCPVATRVTKKVGVRRSLRIQMSLRTSAKRTMVLHSTILFVRFRLRPPEHLANCASS